MKRNEMLNLLRFYVVVGITATCLFMLLDSAGPRLASPKASPRP